MGPKINKYEPQGPKYRPQRRPKLNWGPNWAPWAPGGPWTNPDFGTWGPFLGHFGKLAINWAPMGPQN